MLLLFYFEKLVFKLLFFSVGIRITPNLRDPLQVCCDTKYVMLLFFIQIFFDLVRMINKKNPETNKKSKKGKKGCVLVWAYLKPPLYVCLCLIFYIISFSIQNLHQASVAQGHFYTLITASCSPTSESSRAVVGYLQDCWLPIGQLSFPWFIQEVLTF